MKKILPALLLLFLPTACRKETDRHLIPPKAEVLVRTTPVKDQGTDDFCWAYAMLATIESEHLMMGDSVNLSPQFLARHYLEEQAGKAYLLQASNAANGQQEITTRGMAGTTLQLLQRYGMTHWDAYHPEVNLNVLARKVEKLVKTQKGRGLSRMQESLNRLLDESVRPVPRYVFMLGAEYTAQEFARSVCQPDEYVALTSFAHHPYGSRFALEVPDNIHHETFLNLPPDTLMAHIDRALSSGHPVCWEGDITEPGFNWEQGYARLDDSKEQSTAHGQNLARNRQQDFERGKTTDDHCMELIGIARTPKGRKYYIAKNSWGTQNAYHGLMYLSDNYIRLKTIAVWMSQNAFAATK